jgi:hypothetical protein
LAYNLNRHVGLFPVVADCAEYGLLPFQDCDLWEGSHCIFFVYLLVDKVPDKQQVVDVLVGPVGVEVVEGQFGRHELVGVHEDKDDDRVLGEESAELLFGAQILHDRIDYGA